MKLNMEGTRKPNRKDPFPRPYSVLSLSSTMLKVEYATRLCGFYPYNLINMDIQGSGLQRFFMVWNLKEYF